MVVKIHPESELREFPPDYQLYLQKDLQDENPEQVEEVVWEVRNICLEYEVGDCLPDYQVGEIPLLYLHTKLEVL